MTQWLRRASQGHEMHQQDLEVMGSNPGRVELGVHVTFELYLKQKFTSSLYYVWHWAFLTKGEDSEEYGLDVMSHMYFTQ